MGAFHRGGFLAAAIEEEHVARFLNQLDATGAMILFPSREEALAAIGKQKPKRRLRGWRGIKDLFYFQTRQGNEFYEIFEMVSALLPYPECQDCWTARNHGKNSTTPVDRGIQSVAKGDQAE
ncbi:MAG: hypothetical protein AB1656_05025 [Candidatus Omnitrophota bacterium]